MSDQELESKLCRGNFRCVTCGKPGLDLHQDPEARAITGFCYEHRPASRDNLVLYTGAALSVRASIVKKLVIHKLDALGSTRSGDSSRRGLIATLVPIDSKSGGRYDTYHDNMLIEIIQYCYMLVGRHYTIHNLGKDGEQADCWVTRTYREPYPTGMSVNHKYWGEKEIDGFVRMLQLLAEIHGWEVEDERMSVLERIAKATEDGEKPS